MRISHPCVKSDLFEHVGTYMLDLQLSEDDSFTLSIYLFCSMENGNMFRYQVRRDELFRIQSTFPQNEDGKHLHSPSDETLSVGFYGFKYLEEQGEFEAESREEALSTIVNDLEKSLKHIAG